MNGISALDKAVLDLINAQVILADKKAKDVLIALYKNEDYARALKECAKGFDYEREYNVSIVTARTRPANPKTLVSLVVGILYNLDIGKLNVLDLLKSAYPDTDTTKSYPKFVDDYIIPFVDAIDKIALRQPYDDIKIPNINIYGKIQEELDTAATLIARESLKSDTPQNAEILTLLNNLVHCVTLEDNRIIRGAYLGLRNTAKLYAADITRELDEIRNILTLYGVL